VWLVARVSPALRSGLGVSACLAACAGPTRGLLCLVCATWDCYSVGLGLEGVFRGSLRLSVQLGLRCLDWGRIGPSSAALFECRVLYASPLRSQGAVLGARGISRLGAFPPPPDRVLVLRSWCIQCGRGCANRGVVLCGVAVLWLPWLWAFTGMADVWQSRGQVRSLPSECASPLSASIGPILAAFGALAVFAAFLHSGRLIPYFGRILVPAFLEWGCFGNWAEFLAFLLWWLFGQSDQVRRFACSSR
jgi:hypothetical protein